MKSFHYLFCFLLLPVFAGAQDSTFSTFAFLDINKFNAAHTVYGGMWHDNTSGRPLCEYPKGTGKHAAYNSALWISALDDTGRVFAATELFRSDGVDFWPGPLEGPDTLTYTESYKWARIWKISGSDLNYFLTLSVRTLSNVPAVILEWPAKGNPYAKGNGGVPLTIGRELAPFIDVDGDGLYDPLKGDYPKMKGDQMLWRVFNDNTLPKRASRSLRMGLEIQMCAYAYDRGGATDQIMFHEYVIFNRSLLTYNDLRIGVFADATLGGAGDEGIGFDSSHRMAVTYQMTLPDAVYGNHPPITGLSLLETPGDVYPATLPAAGSFVWFEGSSTGFLRIPNNAPSFRNYMMGKTYGGTDFPYGNPVYRLPDSSACILGDKSTNTIFVLSTGGGFTLTPGAQTRFATAFFATDTVGYACPISDFKPITNLADTAFDIYYHPLPLSQQEWVAGQSRLQVFPNPVSQLITISLPGSGGTADAFSLYDVSGKRMPVRFYAVAGGWAADLSGLASGAYALVYDDGIYHHSQAIIRR